MAAIHRSHCTDHRSTETFAYSFKVDHPVWCDGGGEVGRGGDVEEVQVCGEDTYDRVKG